eukprot:Hpha_TRINITY_DN26367_c0_g1::TRINITY_DN26367_c0_g1_i1::g.9430::m.9430
MMHTAEPPRFPAPSPHLGGVQQQQPPESRAGSSGRRNRHSPPSDFDSRPHRRRGHRRNSGGLSGASGSSPPHGVDGVGVNTLRYVHSDGKEREVHVSPTGPVVRCCDPFNQRVYTLPDQLCEETAGKAAHVSNPAGRRAQICMKYQMGRCNMLTRCQQIHAERGMIAAYREVYVQERKQYIAEIDALDAESGLRLVFKYSEVDACQAKDRYRSLSEQERAHFVVCQSYASTGQCSQGRSCQHVHVSPQTRAKVRERLTTGGTGSLAGSFGAAPSNYSFNSEPNLGGSAASTPQLGGSQPPGAPVPSAPLPVPLHRPPLPTGFPP